MLCARNGSDPSMNAALRIAIENAKAENVPNDNIKRAISKGNSEGKDAAALHEVMYEGYGPAGSAILVEALTDNKNRTYTNVRSTMNKNKGNLGESGSVAYMFEKRGFFEIKVSKAQKDEVMLELMELDPLTIEDYDEIIELTCSVNDFSKMREALMAKNLILETSKLNYIPNMKVEASDQDLETISKLIEKLEEDDDVLEVYTNL